MAKPVHSMIRVFDEASRSTSTRAPSGSKSPTISSLPDFALIYLRHPSSPFEVELTVNFDRKEPYALGDGYGHLAVVVDDRRCRTRPLRARETRAGAAARLQARRQDAGALLLRHRSRWLQDRGDPAGRTLRLIATNQIKQSMEEHHERSRSSKQI